MESKPWRTSRRVGLVTALSTVGVAAVLGMLLWRERAALLQIEVQRLWLPVLIGQILVLGTLTAAAFTWSRIMEALGSRVSRLRHMHIYAVTYLSRHLPGTLWYVVGRGVLYRDQGDPARLVTMASAVELMVSVVSSAAVALAMLVVSSSLPLRTSSPPALIAAAVAVVAGALFLHPATLRWVARLLRLEEIPAVPYRSLAGWVALYTLLWVAGGFIVYLNAQALLPPGTPLRFAFVLFSWTLVGTLSVFLFLLPSNFGLTEIGLSLLLSAVMPSSVAVLVAVLTRVLMLAYSIVGCLAIAAITRRQLQRAEAEIEPPSPADPPASS